MKGNTELCSCVRYQLLLLWYDEAHDSSVYVHGKEKKSMRQKELQ